MSQSTPLKKEFETPNLPNLPSPSPSSNKFAGISVWNEHSPKIESALAENKFVVDSKLTRKESYKAQRKSYRKEKKRVASELFNSLQDPTIIVLADWLKVRGTLKSWTKLWCILKPGLLLLYKSPKVKSSHWVGTVILTSCQVIERPSKKDGFCFKLFHPLDQSIWAPRGPEKESMGAVLMQPLPTSYLIFRAPSSAAGKCWMDALELSLRCSSLLVRSISSNANAEDQNESVVSATSSNWSEAELEQYEKHFNEHDLDIDDNASHVEGSTTVMSAGETESDSENEPEQETTEYPETPYVHIPEEEFGTAGEQVEELAEENKSLLWIILKQVRPGMDLSKVVLPTFILEPRSFLDKLSDTFYHVDIISQAVLEDDPFIRMKLIVKWYLSGFYKKPKGLKKPFNPILGETFRCYWQHNNNSRTFYIAEQVSHHPPVSAFYMTNRQDGFALRCSILARSKFYGNSTSAILEGVGTLTLLPRGENYTLSSPYAHCKGILMGTLSMELGGKVSIECENTGYKTELEFKLRPFLGGNEYTNLVTGKLKLGKQTLATINGHWDGTITMKDTRTNEESVLLAVTPELRQKRLKRYTVQFDAQAPNESERLWQHVIAAIKRDDQVAATEEKTALEEVQRTGAKERKATCTEWMPAHFQQDFVTGHWHYKYADLRPWDIRNDVRQYESDYRIQTITKHQAPIVRTASIISAEPLNILKTESRTSLAARRALSSIQSAATVVNTPDKMDGNSDSSADNGLVMPSLSVIDALHKINNRLDEQNTAIAEVQKQLAKVIKRESNTSRLNLNSSLFVIIAIGVVLHAISIWYLARKH